MATEDQLRDYLKRVTVELSEARRRIDALVEDAQEPIAITGMACRFPGGGDTPDGLWELLHEGRTAVADVPQVRWDMDAYYDPDRSRRGAVYTRKGSFLPDIAGWDASLFGHSPQEALRMDPQQRLLMELVWEGFENAGIAPSRAAGSRTAVMVGFMDTSQYGRLETECYGQGIVADPYFGQGVSASVVAGRLAYHYDLRGPTVTLDTACSSSLVGVHLAAQSLRRGECDLALAGGVFLMMRPDIFVQGCATSMLAPDGRCKTFDSGADGYVLGEGGGMVVLQRLSCAVRDGRRIHAVLRGSAVNQDGRSNGLTAPSRSAQVEVIRLALANARVRPDQVDYVEAHGSGTHLGDAIELSALHDVFADRIQERPLHVGAVKTNLGHTQAAAGIAGLIKTVLTLEHGEIPGNLHMSEPAAAIPADGTVRPVGATIRPSVDERPRIAGVSSFGWSGTNAHVVLQAAPQAPEPKVHGPDDGSGADSDSSHALAVSAGSETALRAQLGQLASWWKSRPELSVPDVAHTLTVGRGEHDFRLAVTGSGRAGLLDSLAVAAAGTRTVRRARQQPRVAFVLAGTGDEYAGAVGGLYRAEPVFAAAVDRCVDVARERCGVDLRPVLDPSRAGTDPIQAPDRADPGALDLAAMLGRRDPAGQASPPDPLLRAEISHPYLFTVEYALATLLRHWGVAPDVLIGYSLGEYVAANLAGVFALDDALHVVIERARLINAAPAGQMAAVAADEDLLRATIAATGAEVDIAAFNGPSMTVVSGASSEVESLTRILIEQGIPCRGLRTPHAFHSSLMEQVRDKLAALIDSVPRHAPHTTIVSNRTGATLSAQDAVDPAYWADHLVGPVRFRAGVQHCLDQSVDVFVELGCGQTLGGLVRQNLPDGSAVDVLGTLPGRWNAAADPAAPRDLREDLLRTSARLWEIGVGVDWSATGNGKQNGKQIVTLPTYPFQRQPYWPEQQAETPAPVRAARAGELCYATSWRADVARTAGSGPALPSPAVPSPAVASPALPGPLLVFADREGVGTELADLAEQAGIGVVEVHPGTALIRDGRRMTIDPSCAEHYREVVAALPSAGPVTLVHLWALLAGAGTGLPGGELAGDAELASAVRYGFDSLLLTLQAFSASPAAPDVRLLTVSRGALEIIGAEANAPHRAIAHGLGRAARHEFPGLTWSGVDLDPETSDGRQTPAVGGPSAGARALICELNRPAASSRPPEVVTNNSPTGTLPAVSDHFPSVTGWRRGRRWLPDYTELPAAGEAAAAVWRPEGTYLITGGTRGLGMTLARHLVGSGVRRLALLSRSAAQPGTDERSARTRADVADLRASGAEVLLLSADVGDPEQLREAVRVCRTHYGALTGVIHAAGVAAGGLVAASTVAGAGRVLAPKVAAMGPLAELVGPGVPDDQRLELLVLYSSAVTAFGGIGESDYCAANTVLDAYGTALSAVAPDTRVVTVAWGPWQHDDWQSADSAGGAGQLAERAQAYRRTYGFSDEAGCALLDRILATGHSSVLAVGQPLSEVLREWSTTLDLDSLLSAAARTPAGERFPRPPLRCDFLAPRTELEAVVAETWGSFLGIDQVGVHDPFFDLGGNSLVGMAMVHAMEKTLQRAIAPALLFAHPTVGEFAAALDPGTGEENDTAELMTSSARGQRRRRSRAGARR